MLLSQAVAEHRRWFKQRVPPSTALCSVQGSLPVAVGSQVSAAQAAELARDPQLQEAKHLLAGTGALAASPQLLPALTPEHLLSDPKLAVVRLFTVGDAAARTLAAYRAVESLCDRKGCGYSALAVHSTALGIDLGNLQDQATLIREVPHCSVWPGTCLSITSRMQTPGSFISTVRCKDK